MKITKTLRSTLPSFLIFVSIVVFPSAGLHAQGSVEMEFLDDGTGEFVSARLLFTKSPRKVPRSNKTLFADDQWLVEQKLPLTLPNGEYEFLAKRGPEFSEIRGGFTIEPKAKDVVSVEIPRSVDMHAEHWFSGDHLSSLPMEALRRWQAADAIDMVVSVAQRSTNEEAKKGRILPSKSKKEDAQRKNAEVDAKELIGLQLATTSEQLLWQHGAVVIHGTTPETSYKNKQHDAPEPSSSTDGMSASEALSKIVVAKSKANATVELMRPWQRDVPVLLATKSIQSIQVLSSYNRKSGDDRVLVSQDRQGILLRGKVSMVLGKERSQSEVFAPIEADDELKYKDARGVGRLSEYLYWQMLEAGLRLTPTAGNDFGANETHLGYNRVYVYSEEFPTEASWWDSIQLGRTVVTNGPLLRVSVNSLPPGSVQASYRGQSIPLDIQASLTVRDPVDYLDVVFNGETIYSARLEDHYRRGEFPPLGIEKSGWLVIRVVTAHAGGYRLATTAPFYFEFDGKPRISKQAVQFFKRWLELSKMSISTDPTESQRLTGWIAQADQFWAQQETQCNAE